VHVENTEISRNPAERMILTVPFGLCDSGIIGLLASQVGGKLGGVVDTPEAVLPFSKTWTSWRVGQRRT